MNEQPALLKPVGPESLAREEDFWLGEIFVRPSLREVSVGKAHEILEPRVMQVLVALARANGAVVSHEELIRQCWGGRIVGDGAISRCVSKVRQLSEMGGTKAFEIDTIARVGYRLRELQLQPDFETALLSPATAPIAPPSATPSRFTNPTRWWAAGVAGLIIVIAAGLLATRHLYQAPGRERQWTVLESHLPFISADEIELYPAISPAGTIIAYSAGPTKNSRHIYLRLLKGGDPIQLTHDAFDASAPAWSRTVARSLTRFSRRGTPAGLWRSPFRPGNRVRLADAGSMSGPISLSIHPATHCFISMRPSAPRRKEFSSSIATLAGLPL